MYPITNGYVIDTPGIKGFGSVDMKEDEVDHYFREIFALSHDCKYDDCKHIEEPGCAVREAVENQVIARSRFDSYLSILGDCKESKYR
jgi:ribosome biogenesis GTPase